jgi:hypothetical protein
VRRRPLIREAEREGWSVEATGSGHIRLTHPRASHPVIVPSTPSDARSDANSRAAMRRALPRPDRPALDQAADQAPR